MMNDSGVPAGWYPDVTNGGMRYWDGQAWTEQRAPEPPSLRPRQRNAGRLPIATIGVGAIVLILLIVAATAGIGSFLAVLGLTAVVTGVFVLITKRRSWALLPPSRPAGAGIAILGLIIALAGGGLHPEPSTQAAATIPVTDTPSPTATVTPTPTPTPAADAYQYDPATAPTTSAAASVVAADSSITTGKAVDVLAALPVKGRAPKTGYDRVGDFGEAWTDVDGNGCDTRNDILARDLTNPTKSGSCSVITGTLNDPYTGKTISFVRGETTSLAVQIDHIVSLSDAWQTGAQQLTAAQRVTLANDPLNLWAVDGPTNDQKGDGDAATWLPPSKTIRCEYAARQISVKATYGLWVTPAEHDALAKILTACPDQPAESSSFTPAPPAPTPSATVEPPAPAAPAPEQPSSSPSDSGSGSGSVYYANCAAARAAGAAPLREGDPGYRAGLDRDHDGVACEN